MLGAFDLKFSELQIFRAYVLLAFVPAGPNGEKAVSLATIGSHEVRLIEFPCTAHYDGSLWLELVATDQQTVIDSARCLVFDEAVAVVKQFIEQARQAQDSHWTSNA